jgi:hypothetical protein
MSARVTVEITETPDPHAGRGVAWYRSREATEGFTEGRRQVTVPLGQDLEVGVELTWRARGRTDRSVERLVATGEASDRVAISAGSEPNAVGVLVVGAVPVGLPAGDPGGA